MDKTDEHCNTKVSTELDNNRSSITVALLLIVSFLYIIFFSIFLSILFPFTVVHVWQILPCSYSQHHITDEEIFRRY
jgi:hypothetical protein